MTSDPAAQPTSAGSNTTLARRAMPRVIICKTRMCKGIQVLTA